MSAQHLVITISTLSFKTMESFKKNGNICQAAKEYVLQHIYVPDRIMYAQLSPGLYMGLKFIEIPDPIKYSCKEHNCKANEECLLIYSKRFDKFYSLLRCCYTNKKFDDLKNSNYLEENGNIILLIVPPKKCELHPPGEPLWRNDKFIKYFNPLRQFILVEYQTCLNSYVDGMVEKSEKDLMDYYNEQQRKIEMANQFKKINI